MNDRRFRLTYAVDPAYGLQLAARIQDRFDEQDVRGFDQVQAVGARSNWQQQTGGISVSLESV